MPDRRLFGGFGSLRTRGLRNTTGLDAGGASVNRARLSIDDGTDAMKVRGEKTRRDSRGMQTDTTLVLRQTMANNTIAGERLLAANSTNSGHR